LKVLYSNYLVCTTWEHQSQCLLPGNTSHSVYYLGTQVTVFTTFFFFVIVYKLI